MLRPVNRGLGEIQTNNAVISLDRFGNQPVEYPRLDPFVPPASQGGVRHPPAQKPFGGYPGTTGYQPDQEPLKTHPIRNAGVVTSERMSALPLR